MTEYVNTREIPSYLDSRTVGESGCDDTFDTNGVMLGEVKALIYPKEKRSMSQYDIGYEVDVECRTGNGPTTTVTFSNCKLSNLFGGIADHCFYTLRADEKKNRQSFGFGVGSKVLVVCLNGDRSRPFIISGVHDDAVPYKKGDEHHFDFAFNGFQWNINKDGETKFTFLGATKANGDLVNELPPSQADKTGSGANISFVQDGSILLNSGYKGGDELQIAMLHNSEFIRIQNTCEWAENSDNGNIQIYAQGRIYLTHKEGVYIGEHPDKMALFERYRKAESQMNSDLSDGLQNVSNRLIQSGVALGIAGTALSATTMANLTTNVPAAGAQLTTIALQLAMLGSDVAKMMAAIKKFEAKPDDYLSKKNKND